ncbi:extracellular solute-binding protein [Paenibacillus hemerocallicola]|jgi:multiple sugar transport system substrate-binding protein|uniref:Extracellular solute-binding protein n=2 Tax=Paenibacillus hemerocallicola TaxID=1172614 RepID=A0A5C4T0Z4_9BACL|nr:extracellular solute-binding protein [Paenibacillus hemerocallicola]
MRMNARKPKSWMVLLLLVAVLAACGKSEGATTGAADGGGTAQPAEPPKPVTLNFFYNGYSKQLVDELQQKVEAKYPHIKLNMIIHGTGSTIQDTLAAGTSLDLVAFSAGGLFTVLDVQLATDMSDLVKKHDFDLNRLSPSVLETVKSYYEGGKLMIMPYELNNNVLYYNKNIFDKFGVAYPRDGMTWNEVYEIAKKLTRLDNGVQYEGFQYNHLNMVYKNQMGLPFVDPKTNKAAINTDQWRKWMELMTRFYQFDGNHIIGLGDGVFIRRQEAAMYTGPSLLDQLPDAVNKGMDWDVVSLPRFDGMADTGSQMNAPFYAIPPTSKNRDESFRVIAYLLSDEIQGANARKGRVPVVKSENVVKDFGADLPILKGKNTAAFFKDTIGKPIAVTKYDGIARSTFTEIAVDGYSKGKFDISTALRTAEEEINKKIAEAQKNAK